MVFAVVKNNNQLFQWLMIFVLTFYGCGRKAEKDKENLQVTETELPSSPDLSDTQIIQHFLYTAYQGDMDKVKAYLAQGIDVNQVNENKQNALMMSAYNGNTALVKFLLAKGAQPDSKDAVGRTPLMYAASGPFPETVRVLLDQGVDPNTVDEDEHWTALMFAASEGQMDVVKLLVRRGANVNLADVDGDTAASFARKNNFIDVADWLEKRMK